MHKCRIQHFCKLEDEDVDNLFPVEGHTMNVKRYLPITKGCLEYFSRYLWHESFSMHHTNSLCVFIQVLSCVLRLDSLTCLRYRIATLPNEYLATESSEVISKILSTTNAHCASSLWHSLIVTCILWSKPHKFS